LLWLDDLVRDLRYGFRMARNAKLISIAVILTLAIGIGINTGVFTLINGLMLRPRTDSDPATFSRLYAQYWLRGNPLELGGQFSAAAYHAIQRESKVLQELAAWRTDGVLIEEEATSSLALEVSCNFFAVYGLTRPSLGRLFGPDECASASEERVVVLAEEAWRSRFAADPHILGKVILLNRQPFTVIGITPVDFAGRLRGPGIWVPYTMQHRLTGNEDIFRAERTPTLRLEGRLRPGRTREQLAADANVIAGRVPAFDPDLKQRVLVTSGALIEDPNVRANSFWILLLIGTGATLLLVSCASGAVLLLSRAIARRQEIAVRISLGAAGRRVLRQLLSENLLLAAVAGALGLYLALQIPKAFQKLAPAMPHYSFTLDWHVFDYLAAITLAAAIFAGIAPAAECLRQDVWISLKGKELSLSAVHARWKPQDLLVIAQVSFSVVLMVTSVMFSRAVVSIFRAEPGFETRHVLAVPLELGPERYDPAETEAFYRSLQERLAGTPLVDAVATSSISPLMGDGEEGVRLNTEFRLPTQASGGTHSATVRAVSQNYFATVGIPLVLGQVFRNTLSDENAVMTSQSFATAFWPAQDPIGREVIAPDGKRLRVLGVVRDTYTGYTRQPDGPCIYMLRTIPARGDLVLVRFRGDADPIAAAVKHIARDLDPQMLVLSSTLRAQMDYNAEQGWVIGKMLLFVAGVAGLLALLGIYGAVGYSVTRRTREFGIRAALGANPRELMRLVFNSGLRPVIAGTLAGTIFAVLFSFILVNALRRAPLPLNPTSPVSYGLVCASLVFAALVAMIGHARRAARIQPLVALREE
jgi:putative ABC transport system permease protein